MKRCSLWVLYRKLKRKPLISLQMYSFLLAFYFYINYTSTSVLTMYITLRGKYKSPCIFQGHKIIIMKKTYESQMY